LRAEIGERTICDRLASELSAKLGGFGARSFEAAIDAAVTAMNLTAAVTTARVFMLVTTTPAALTGPNVVSSQIAIDSAMMF
jgi:hypothetical protein